MRCIPDKDILTCGPIGFAQMCTRPRSANPAQAGRRDSTAGRRPQVFGPCARCRILPVSHSKGPMLCLSKVFGKCLCRHIAPLHDAPRQSCAPCLFSHSNFSDEELPCLLSFKHSGVCRDPKCHEAAGRLCAVLAQVEGHLEEETTSKGSPGGCNDPDVDAEPASRATAAASPLLPAAAGASPPPIPSPSEDGIRRADGAQSMIQIICSPAPSSSQPLRSP